MTGAGQLYRAKARRGFRYARVLRMIQAGGQRWATCAETNSRGRRLRARDRRGFRPMLFRVLLQAGERPVAYELVAA